MSAADLKSGVARLRFGSRNEALETALTDLLKRNLVTIDLKFEPVQQIELRRPRDDALMARLVDLHKAWEKLIDIHSDLIEALKREGLAPRGEGEQIVPVAGGEEIARGVARALESSLKRPPDESSSEPDPRKKTAWDILESAIGSVDAPADWALEHDHYLYGTPKRGEK